MGNQGFLNVPRYTTGLAATGLSLFFMVNGRENLPILFASAFFVLICIYDTLYTRIPNAFTSGLVVVGLLLNMWQSGLPGLLSAGLGLALGLCLLLPPFLLGGMGAGDVKALAALGSLLGPGAAFQVFLYTALIGGVFAVIQYLASPQRLQKLATWHSAVLAYVGTREIACLAGIPSGEKLRFPYASAMAFGYYAFVLWGNLFLLLERI